MGEGRIFAVLAINEAKDMVAYAAFIEKFTQFSELEESRFDAFLADAAIEIDRIPTWGTLKERATENLLAHLLVVSNPDDQKGAAAESVKADDQGFDIKLIVGDSSLDSTVYGREYSRLRAIATSTTPELSGLSSTQGQTWHGVRGNPSEWTSRF